MNENSDLMTSGEVARAFRVDPKTVTRWANEGRLDCIKTPGGQRRFFRIQIDGMLQVDTPGGAK